MRAPPVSAGSSVLACFTPRFTQSHPHTLYYGFFSSLTRSKMTCRPEVPTIRIYRPKPDPEAQSARAVKANFWLGAAGEDGTVAALPQAS